MFLREYTFHFSKRTVFRAVEVRIWLCESLYFNFRFLVCCISAVYVIDVEQRVCAKKNFGNFWLILSD